MTQLEQLVDCTSYASNSIDSYALDTAAMYTGPLFDPMMQPNIGVMRYDPAPIMDNFGLSTFRPIVPTYEPFKGYDLGETQVHIHESGMGSIKRGNDTLYNLDRYQTSMADHDLGGALKPFTGYCKPQRDW